MDLQLADPLIQAMVALLSQSLNTTITERAKGDGFDPEPISQFLDYIPTASALQGGLPAIGVGEMETLFSDDTQFSMNATHEYAVMAVIQNADHRTLALQLRRTLQAIAATVQADRLLGNNQGLGGIMRDQGGALSVNFIRTEPGPVLGDMDGLAADAPPRTYLTWTALVFTSERVEIGA